MANSKRVVSPPQNGKSLAYDKRLPEARRVHVVDLFCGCGGMSLGFSNTRQSHLAFDVVGGIDIDQCALDTYERNVRAPTAKADIRDIADGSVSLEQLLPSFDPESRPLVFIGCAPCQGFSAHRRKDPRDDSRNNLLLTFADVCERYTPDVIVMENVPEILTGKHRQYFEQAAHRLETLGYSLTFDVLDLSLYGVPQRRRRAVVLGAREGAIALPPPVFTKDNAPTVRQAISHLRPILSGETDTWDTDHVAPNHTERILERIRATPQDGGDRRALSVDEQLDCHAAIDNGATPGFTDVYGRLRWDTPSVTITAKSSTPSCGRFVHPDQHRNISVREAAILQGFPQFFELAGSLVHKYRQIGEAVPPSFARFVAWQILDHFSRRSRRGAQVHKRIDTHHGSANPSPSGRVQVVDSFCGAGGMALGFKAAGFPTALGFDIDQDAASTFQANLGCSVERISVTDPTLLRLMSKSVGGSPYVVIGGPPCQGFSQQRRGQDSDPRNNLVTEFGNLIGALARKPIAVVLENVTYLDAPRGRVVLKAFVAEMERIGYKVFRHDLHCADYGVPQLRKRIVIVALRTRYAVHYGGPRRITAGRWLTVGEVLGGLPEPNSPQELALLPNHDASREGPLNKRRIAYVDMGKGRMAIPPELQLDCHTKYGGHLDVYGRLDWFGPARTITGGFDSFTRGEYAHPFHHRSITPREAARIQGFPDWFGFSGNRAAVRRQIGNAVPPPMAYAVAKGIGRALAKGGLK